MRLHGCGPLFGNGYESYVYGDVVELLAPLTGKSESVH
jgi:hypothetical protein